MGIVIKQSIQNTLITFVGFGFGAANILFMYPFFLGNTFFGLTGYVLSTASILYPLMSFGIQNTLIKFFNEHNKSDDDLNGYMTFMLVLPLFFCIPLFLLFGFFYDAIASYEAKNNPIVYQFVWIIPVIALFMGYFEIFYAWLRAHLKSVFGSFVKEIFVRILITISLLFVYYKLISPEEFIYSLVFIYGISLLVLIYYANKVKKIAFSKKIPKKSKAIIRFTAYIIFSASIANMLLDIDKYMIKYFMKIDNIAFYSVAIFIAMVISVPSRAMHQITYPITAKLMVENKWDELNSLYKKSSLSLQVVGGWILLGIVLNIKQLYLMLPPEYSQGIWVVFAIGLSKYFDLILGNNNAIIFNSKYYKMVLFLGLALVVLVVILNAIFIPKFGINGAAYATLIAVSLYSLSKLAFVVFKMNLFPFTKKTMESFGILIACFSSFYFWDFDFFPILNIALKSVLITLFYLGLSYFFKISADINTLISKKASGFFKK